MLRHKMLTCLLLSGLFILSGCYRVPIPQGNVLTEQNVHRIIPGMTTTDVIKILGSPVLHNTFANNQVTYVYTYKVSTKPMILKRAIVYLQNNRVTHVSFESNQKNK